MFDPKKRAFFVRLLGEEATASLEAGLKAQGRLLEEQGVNWAELGACVGGACPRPAAPAAAPTSPASPYIAQLQAPAPAGVAAVQAALRTPGASPVGNYIADLGGERTTT